MLVLSSGKAVVGGYILTTAHFHRPCYDLCHTCLYHCAAHTGPQFVAMDGYRKHGLVHASQVANNISFSREDTDEEKKAEMVRGLYHHYRL
jgi:hypothetical protein